MYNSDIIGISLLLLIPDTSVADTCHSRVIYRIEEEIYEINQGLGRHQQIRKWEIIPDKWTIETVKLSPTLKVQRKFLIEKYARLIAEMSENL